jgi:ABC-type lipoprotein release transport system permease subunit
MASLLYQVEPSDPMTFAVVPLALIGVAVAASYLPALRATRVSPVSALRTD